MRRLVVTPLALLALLTVPVQAASVSSITGPAGPSAALGVARRDSDRKGERSSDVSLHDIHLTYSRVVVDGATVLWRVRLFRDDLEKALQTAARSPTLRADSPAADSVFLSYFASHVSLTSGGKRLTARVLQSGRDPDVTDEEMWWYLLEFTLPAPAPRSITSVGVRVGLLFELFSDQRNVVTLLKMPGESRRSLYFVPGDVTEQVVSW